MNRLHVTLAALTLGAALTACKDPAARVAHAATSTAAPTPAGGTAPAPGAQRLAIDAASSRVQFTASKVTRSHEGSFGQFAGTIDFSPEHLEASRVHIDIEMASLSTDTERLTSHLRTADFFDVARFPRATFDSVEIRPGGERGASHTLSGNLTLHGQTRLITFPATITVSPSEVAATSEFSIDRRDFGLVYPGMANDLIRDNVVIRLNVHAPRPPR